MQKFLVIQTAFIGDVVLTTGIIEKLHHFFPEAEIDFLVRKGNEALLANHPFLHEVLIWNKGKNKYGNLFALLKKIRAHKYDKIINVQRFAATGFLTAFSNAKETIGFDKNPWSFFFNKKIKHQISTIKNPIHEIERNNLLIEDFTNSVAAKPKLYPSKNNYDSVQSLQNQRYVCIAPASVWFTKQYPKQKWISFISKLPSSINIYLLGSPSDKILCEEIKKASDNPNIFNLAGKLNFLESAALQKDALMNYVNDSAPLHFASAVNAPVTAVYCSTIPAFGFGPLSDESFIVEKNEPLYCRPCGLHGYKACPQKHFKCALDISDEQLLITVSKKLT
ncbi:MAG: glycosyltransferase family 9 protein [Chitinophagaceae bacterium]